MCAQKENTKSKIDRLIAAVEALTAAVTTTANDKIASENEQGLARASDRAS